MFGNNNKLHQGEEYSNYSSYTVSK